MSVPRPVRAAGFSLLELMVTVAVAGILLAIGVPSFKSVIATNRLVSATNELVATLQQARMEALRRNRQTVVCRSTDGTTCAATAGSWNQWVTFVDLDGDRTPDITNDPATNELVRVGEARAPVQIATSSAILSNRIIFRADGFAHPADASKAPTTPLLTAAFGVCVPTSQPPENKRIVQIATGSRISMKPATDATCNTAVPN